MKMQKHSRSASKSGLIICALVVAVAALSMLGALARQPFALPGRAAQSPPQAANLVGQWQWHSDGLNGKLRITTQNSDGAFSGEYTDPQWASPFEGKIQDNKIEFLRHFTWNDGKRKEQRYKVTLVGSGEKLQMVNGTWTGFDGRSDNGGGDFAAEKTSMQGGSLKTEKGKYKSSEPIVVEFSDLPGNNKDWIAVAAATAKDDDYKEYHYSYGEVEGNRTFEALPEGKYEARLYYNWEGTKAYKVQGRYPFVVSDPTEWRPIKLDTTRYGQNDFVNGKTLEALSKAGQKFLNTVDKKAGRLAELLPQAF